MKIQIINGPNMNLVGEREKPIYGNQSVTSFLADFQKKNSSTQIDHFQSNIEGEIIDKLHEIGFSYDGIILNGGGYSHTSVAIRDAVMAIKTRVIEVHLSNVYARESFRHPHMVAAACIGVISGFGLEGYAMGVQYFIKEEKNRHE